MTDLTYTIVGSDRVPIDELEPHPNNARNGDLGVIMRSLREFGQFRRLVVNRHSGHIVMGNHTWAAMRQVGFGHADVDYIDEPDPDRELAMVLADNRASDLATWNDALLHRQLKEMGDTERIGWTDEDLARLEASQLADLSPLQQHDNAAAEAADYQTPPADQTPPPPSPPSTPGESSGLGNPVIAYQIVFDDEDQKRLWVAFVKWLRANIDGETTGERLASFVDSQGITG